MLQEYLNANLLPLSDDEDSKKLKRSADEIVKKLTKSKAKVVSYILTSIDPDISADNPDILEVKEIIIKNWSTFVNNTKDTPLTYIRAVMLEALDSISVDIVSSMLIWFASRNIIKYHKLIGEEKKVILKFLSKLGNSINQRANLDWALSTFENSSLKTLELKEIATYLINDDTLLKYLEDASGPKNEQGKANYDSPNPHWPDTGNSWSYEFPKRAAKGLKAVIDVSLKAIATVSNENKNKIQDILKEFFEAIQREVPERNKSLQLRSELLWWKEAKYSSSIDKSYWELNSNILEIILAYDYSSFIPPISPKSVDYFLIETCKEFKSNTLQEITIEDSLKLFEQNSEELMVVLPESDIIRSKTTLLNFISAFVWNKCRLSEFENMVGIPIDIKLSPTELTIWLFHDFQISKILNSK